MATPIIAEYIYEMTRAVGDAYVAISDGVGSVDVPGSALHAVGQLSDLANKNIPYFGILRTVDPDDASYESVKGFRATIPDITVPEIYVGSGLVAYNGQVINIEPQYIVYARDFADSYPVDYVYGAVIGFSIAEARKFTSVHTTLVSADAIKNSYTLRVDEISVPANLGFPLNGYIGNELISFTGITQESGVSVLQIDASSNGLLTEKRKGSQVYFIYSPKIKCLCGLPVDTPYQSSKNPDLFQYYPPVPKDWLQICKFLVEVKNGVLQPRIIKVSSTIVDPYTDCALVDLVVDYPYGNSTTPIFSTADADVISAAAELAGNSLVDLQQKVNPSEIIRALQSYTEAVKPSKSMTFKKFWAEQPFSPTTYFAKGVSFDNLERFVFADNFIKAYYDLTGEDLHHVFAIFRGDLYQASLNYNIANNVLQPSDLEIGYYSSLSSGSLLSSGTYIYGVTAVNDKKQETSATYLQVESNISTSYINEIKKTPPEDTGVVYYHVYRRQNLAGDQIEYKLTSDNTLTTLVPLGNPQFSYVVDDIDTVLNKITLNSIALQENDVVYFSVTSGNSLPGGLVSGRRYSVFGYSSGVFGLKYGADPVDITSAATGDVYIHIDTVDYMLDTANSQYMFKIVSTGADAVCGGIGIYLRFPADFVVDNASETLTIDILESDKVTVKATGSVLSYGQIVPSENYSEYIVTFNNVILDADTEYWVTLKQSTAPVDAQDVACNIYVKRSVVGFDNSEFYDISVIDNLETCYYGYGFVDNGNITAVSTTKRGIKLTNSIALVPSQLQVYVPEIDVVDPEPYSRMTNDTLSDISTTNTRNELLVTVLAKNGENGIIETFDITVPKNTTRGASFPIGISSNVFDRVVDVQVRPGSSSNLRISQGHINWSIYDLVTVEVVH